MTPQEPTGGAFIKGIVLGIVPGAIVMPILNLPLDAISSRLSQGHSMILIFAITAFLIGAGLAYASGFWKRPLTLQRGFLTGLVLGYFGAIGLCTGTTLSGK